MTKILLILCIYFSLVSTALAKVPDIVLKQKKAVITLYTSDKDGNQISMGSGFIIAANGVIATNYHVISDWLTELENTLLIKMENGAFFPIEKLINFDERNDLALLKIRGTELPTVRLAKSSRQKQGDDIFVIGSPLQLEVTVSTGIISSMSRQNGTIQITAPISPGSSGSPVFNSRGEVIGVARSAFEGGQNLNFAIGTDRILDLLDNAKQSARLEKDLIKYYAQLTDLIGLEKEIIDIYSSVTGSNYTDDSVLHDVLRKTVVPKYADYLKKLNAIKPATKELRSVHALLVNGSTLQFDSFSLFLRALEKQDIALMQQGNAKLNEGRSDIEASQRKLRLIYRNIVSSK